MVPEGWTKLKLEDISQNVTSGSRNWAQYYSDTGSKFIRMTNLQRDGIHLNLSDLKYVDVKSDSADGKRTSLEPEDILISITAELGKIGWVPYGLGEAYINQHTSLVRLNKDRVFSQYIAYLLVSKEMNHLINRLNDAGAKAGLNLSTIRSIPLCLPPFQEQKKIAQILSTWDKAITTTERLLKNSQQHKKALMQQLLTGKNRLLNDNGVRFSSAWKIGHLNDFVRKIYGGGTPQRSNPDYWGGSIPWITVKDLVKTHIDGAQESINEKGLNESAANLVRKGTIIIATRMAVGKTVVASCDVAINQDLKAIIPTDDLCSEYLFNWFIFNSSKIEKMGTGSTVKGVQVESIRKLKIKIPGSIKEQRSIIKVLDNIEQVTLFYKQKISCLKQEKKALMQQLLTGKRRVKVGIKEVA